MEHSGADTTTISYYDANAADFVAGTVGASMRDALGRFAALLPQGGRVLDWGCGSGRDAKALAEAGFQVVATDASEAMCQAAGNLAGAVGVTTRNEGFLALEEEAAYDGIWACASLLHLRRSALPEAFARAHRALKAGGVLYASFKLGGFEGYRSGRWFTDLRQADLAALLPAETWQLLETWQSGDVRQGRGDQLWLNFLARRA